MLLLGTTDEEYESDPADVAVNEKDTAQILDEAAFSIKDQQLSRDLITYSFAGLRVLPGGPGDTSKAKRETVVTEGRGGMLSVAGGKWTTFRHIGRTVMNKLAALPGHPLADDMEPISRLPKKLPLPGIANPNAVAHRLLIDGGTPGPRMAADTARHLATHYGSLAFDIARLANEKPALAERVHPDAPEIWAQVAYARDHEWAETADDVLRRMDDADDPGPGDGRDPGRLSSPCSATGAEGAVRVGRGGSRVGPPRPYVRTSACRGGLGPVGEPYGRRACAIPRGDLRQTWFIGLFRPA